MGTQGILALLVLLCANIKAQTVDDADIVLLMDSSDSHRSTNFNEEKKFALDLIVRLYNSNTRISTYTFGENAYSQFTFDMYNDITMLKQAIQYMWYSTGDGSVDTAINFTIVDAFQKSNGDRECVANFLIVLAHSSIKDAATATMLKDVLATQNIRTIVLNMAGASSSANFAILTNNTNYVIDITDWSALQLTDLDVSNIIQTDHPSTGCGLLSTWGDWTGCSMTCGEGFQFRTRSCIKEQFSDKDCSGVFSEDKPCTLTDCKDPVDGNWAFWGKWEKCSKTCETGVQQRTRGCTQPAPLNGGKLCPGNSTQTRPCAEYKCPDCRKQCPTGGQLSKDCDVCECTQLTLFGQILNDDNQTVVNARIFLESSMYKPLATTDRFGIFKVDGICLMNENVFIYATGCISKHVTPITLNTTHWTIPDMKLERNVPPVFTIQPEDKVRMIGQSLSLCCAAVGKPQPASYKWFKDEIELDNIGTNGSLILSHVNQGHGGVYVCSTETEAGISQSDEAEVKVFRTGTDTCSSPQEELQELPFGCYVTGDATKNTTIDVGTCGKLPCMKSSLHDNGSCSDYWSHHCCEVKDTQVVEIACNGFSYKTTRVLSCECKPCIYKTVVNGRAFGIVNDTEMPLQLGEIIIKGQVFAHTSMAGTFKLELPKGMNRIVATFQDNIYKRFVSVTKIFQINSGSETFATVVIPLKPTPIPFNTANETHINLGDKLDGKNPAGKISIPADSVVNQKGQPFTGEVQASVHYMDPRSRDDIEAANGDFESESADGRKVPLKTFGMFQFEIHDNNKQRLFLNKPMKVSLASTAFNVPLDKDGNPDLSLWSYDTNKGIWVEQAKMRNETTGNTRRKLLAVNNAYVAEIHPNNIPAIDQYDRSTVQTLTGYRNVWNPPYQNYDKKEPIYDYIPVKTPKAGACFVSVSVYKDLSLKQAYVTGDIEIKTYIKMLDGSSYVGATSTKVLRNGRACIPIFCDKLVYIHVTRNGKERMYAGEHYLPIPGIVKSTTNNEIEFESRDFGVRSQEAMLKTLPQIKQNTIFDGPVFQLSDKNRCSRLSATDNSFQFKFAPFTRAPTPNFVAGSGVFDKKLSWYPVSPATLTFRSCFMKVAIKIQNTYDLRLIAKSHLNDVSGDEFGTYEVGPMPDPTKNDTTTRGACFEFRCPGLVNDGGNKRTDIPTAVTMYLNTQRNNMTCRIENVKSGLNVTAITDPSTARIRGFNFYAEAGNNYGEKYGIFISNNPAAETLKVCEPGVSYGSNGLLSPLTNPAVTINCL